MLKIHVFLIVSAVLINHCLTQNSQLVSVTSSSDKSEYLNAGSKSVQSANVSPSGKSFYSSQDSSYANAGSATKDETSSIVASDNGIVAANSKSSSNKNSAAKSDSSFTATDSGFSKVNSNSISTSENDSTSSSLSSVGANGLSGTKSFVNSQRSSSNFSSKKSFASSSTSTSQVAGNSKSLPDIQNGNSMANSFGHSSDLPNPSFAFPNSPDVGPLKLPHHQKHPKHEHEPHKSHTHHKPGQPGNGDFHTLPVDLPQPPESPLDGHHKPYKPCNKHGSPDYPSDDGDFHTLSVDFPQPSENPLDGHHKPHKPCNKHGSPDSPPDGDFHILPVDSPQRPENPDDGTFHILPVDLPQSPENSLTPDSSLGHSSPSSSHEVSPNLVKFPKGSSPDYVIPGSPEHPSSSSLLSTNTNVKILPGSVSPSSNDILPNFDSLVSADNSVLTNISPDSPNSTGKSLLDISNQVTLGNSPTSSSVREILPSVTGKDSVLGSSPLIKPLNSLEPLGTPNPSIANPESTPVLNESPDSFSPPFMPNSSPDSIPGLPSSNILSNKLIGKPTISPVSPDALSPPLISDSSGDFAKPSISTSSLLSNKIPSTSLADSLPVSPISPDADSISNSEILKNGVSPPSMTDLDEHSPKTESVINSLADKYGDSVLPNEGATLTDISRQLETVPHFMFRPSSTGHHIGPKLCSSHPTDTPYPHVHPDGTMPFDSGLPSGNPSDEASPLLDFVSPNAPPHLPSSGCPRQRHHFKQPPTFKPSKLPNSKYSNGSPISSYDTPLSDSTRSGYSLFGADNSLPHGRPYPEFLSEPLGTSPYPKDYSLPEGYNGSPIGGNPGLPPFGDHSPSSTYKHLPYGFPAYDSPLDYSSLGGPSALPYEAGPRFPYDYFAEHSPLTYKHLPYPKPLGIPDYEFPLHDYSPADHGTLPYGQMPGIPPYEYSPYDLPIPPNGPFDETNKPTHPYGKPLGLSSHELSGAGSSLQSPLHDSSPLSRYPDYNEFREILQQKLNSKDSPRQPNDIPVMVMLPRDTMGGLSPDDLYSPTSGYGVDDDLFEILRKKYEETKKDYSVYSSTYPKDIAKTLDTLTEQELCYDTVIIGSDTSSLIALDTLSANGRKILYIGNGYAPPHKCKSPYYRESLLNSQYVRRIKATSPYSKTEKTIYAPCVLGEASSYDLNVWDCGVRNDYTKLSTVSRKWSWKNVVNYFTLDDNTISTGQQIESTKATNAIFTIFGNSSVYPIPYTTGKRPEGISTLPYLQKNNENYVLAQQIFQQLADRQIQVALQTQVKKIIFENGKAIAIDLLTPSGAVKRVRILNNLILGSNPIDTVKLLHDSGVGKENALQKLGIPLEISVPHLGQGFSVSPRFAGIFYQFPKNTLLNRWDSDYAGMRYLFGEYNLPTVSTVDHCNAFLKLYNSQEANIMLNFRVFSSSTLHRLSGFVDRYFNGDERIHEFVFNACRDHDILFVIPQVLGPRSTGKIEVSGSEPIVDTGMYTNKRDLALMLKALKVLREVGHNEAFKALHGEVVEIPVDGCGKADFSPRYNKCSIYNLSSPSLHYTGGAIMGVNPATSVVNDELLLHGSSNVYLFSTAVLPYGMSTDSAGVGGLIGKYGAHLLNSKNSV